MPGNWCCTGHPSVSRMGVQKCIARLKSSTEIVGSRSYMFRMQECAQVMGEVVSERSGNKVEGGKKRRIAVKE